MATISSPDPLRILLDLILLVSVGYYLVYCLLRILKPGGSVSSSAPADPASTEVDLLQDLADGVLGIDGEDHIVYSSKRAESLLGFNGDELRLRNYQSFLVLPDGFNESSARELKNGEITIGLEHQAWALRKDGSRFAVRVTVTPCRQGPVRALVAIRASQSGEPLSRATSGLEPERLLPSADRIRKFATLLGNSPGLSVYDRDFLRALQESTDHLYADINLFKCLKAIEANEIKVETQPLHFGQWLEKESLAYRRLAEKHGCHLTIPEVKNSGFVLLTDEKILSQIYQALLDFSLTTYQSPSVTFHLTHSTENPVMPPSGSWKGAVPGNELQIRFLIIVAAPRESFVSKPVHGGNSILETIEADPHILLARQLLPLIGADLAIDANEFSGLLFQFSLSCKSLGLTRHPALTQDAPEPQDPAKAPSPGNTPEPGETKGDAERQTGTILSIAEDSNLKKWVREILVAEGFRVEECPPGEAIEKIRDGKKADVVVLQRELSTEPDFDLTYEIRQLRKAEDMPILLVHVGDHPDPKISYFCAEDAIDFPAENKVLREKVSALYGLKAQS